MFCKGGSDFTGTVSLVAAERNDKPSIENRVAAEAGETLCHDESRQIGWKLFLLAEPAAAT
jgi:hypothetical protein